MIEPMQCRCVPYREIPQTTKLFASFTGDFSRVAGYFGHAPSESGVVEAAREVRLDPAVRRGVVEVLREQNRRFGAGSDTERNLDRLAAGAVAVVTGQQVGLFGGPAFSFYKSISAVCWAESLTRRGVDAVPIFWLATEDHDLAEINHAFLNTRAGLERLELPSLASDAGKHVGEVTLGRAVDDLVAKAAGTLEGPSAEEITRALRESYAPDETYGSAFGKLMARLMAGRGIIFIDPLDARLHRLAAPVYRGALDAAAELREALVVRSKELEAGGFHAQVKVSGVSTLLFYDVNGLRTPLRSHNGGYSAGDASFTADELRAAIEKTPEAFSPNALLRPVVQDSLLPTAAYIGGPAEIAYLAQSHVVYNKLLGRMPAILPRQSFTLIEPGIARILQKFELDLPDLFEGRQSVRAKMERKALPGGLAQRFDSGEAALRELLETYRAPLKDLDPTLLGTLDAVNEKMLYQFLKLKGKAGEAENLRTGVLDRKERLLLDSLYPHHELQERSLSLLPFFAAYGTGLLDELGRFCGPDAASQHAPQHHILFL
jgi:bacillithiol biosynthesis cysteine-adding enzyme BshC